MNAVLPLNLRDPVSFLETVLPSFDRNFNYLRGRFELISDCKSHTSAIESLLQRGSDPCEVDARRNTPLHLSAESHSPSAVEILLKHGASVSCQYRTYPIL